jgi:hypothetical protein
MIHSRRAWIISSMPLSDIDSLTYYAGIPPRRLSFSSPALQTVSLRGLLSCHRDVAVVFAVSTPREPGWIRKEADGGLM